eukprot:scaffold401_cov399-Prasinococcus_capsulatus_cf.AAC.46
MARSSSKTKSPRKLLEYTRQHKQPRAARAATCFGPSHFLGETPGSSGLVFVAKPSSRRSTCAASPAPPRLTRVPSRRSSRPLLAVQTRSTSGDAIAGVARSDLEHLVPPPRLGRPPSSRCAARLPQLCGCSAGAARLLHPAGEAPSACAAPGTRQQAARQDPRSCHPAFPRAVLMRHSFGTGDALMRMMNE